MGEVSGEHCQIGCETVIQDGAAPIDKGHNKFRSSLAVSRAVCRMNGRLALNNEMDRNYHEMPKLR